MPIDQTGGSENRLIEQIAGDSIMTAHVVIHYDGTPMPLILFVGDPCFLSIPQILARYAESHAFELEKLTGYWAPILDYQKQAEHPSVEIARQFREDHVSLTPYTLEQFSQFLGAEILQKQTLIRRKITVFDDPQDLFERFVFVDGSPVGQIVKG